MKKPLLYFPAAAIAAGIISLVALAGCGKSSSPSPTRAKVSISRLQTDGTNTMLYVEARRLDAGEPYLERLGSNSDSYNGVADTGPETEVLTGKYSFRVWYPEVVAHPPYVANPPLRGKAHADLLVNGKVAASLDLDALRPNFERDTCSRTVTVQVQ